MCRAPRSWKSKCTKEKKKKTRKKTRATGGVEAGSPSLTEWVASHDCLSSVRGPVCWLMPLDVIFNIVNE